MEYPELSRICIVTANSRLVDGWASRVKEVRAPSNYKDPVKIEAYIAEKRAGLEEELQAVGCLQEFSDIQVAEWGPNRSSSIREMLTCPSPLLVVGRHGRAILKRLLQKEPEWVHDHTQACQHVWLGASHIRYATLAEITHTAAERNYLLPSYDENDLSWMRISEALHRLGVVSNTIGWSWHEVVELPEEAYAHCG